MNKMTYFDYHSSSNSSKVITFNNTEDYYADFGVLENPQFDRSGGLLTVSDATVKLKIIVKRVQKAGELISLFFNDMDNEKMSYFAINDPRVKGITYVNKSTVTSFLYCKPTSIEKTEYSGYTELDVSFYLPSACWYGSHTAHANDGQNLIRNGNIVGLSVQFGEVDIGGEIKYKVTENFKSAPQIIRYVEIKPNYITRFFNSINIDFLAKTIVAMSGTTKFNWSLNAFTPESDPFKIIKANNSVYVTPMGTDATVTFWYKIFPYRNYDTAEANTAKRYDQGYYDG